MNIPPVHWEIKDFQELFEGGLVHDIDRAHLRDQEVQDAPSGGHGTELLTSCVDLNLRLSRCNQFLADILCRCLGDVQHINQVFIIN